MKKREIYLAIFYMALGGLLCFLSSNLLAAYPIVPVLGIACIISGFCMMMRNVYWKKRHLEEAPRPSDDED